jgi:hypothetical protein
LVLLAVGFTLAVTVNVGCMKCGSDVTERLTEEAIEGAIEKSSGGKVDIDVGKTVDMSGCPAFLQYPGAKGIGKWSMTTGDGSGSVYSFETGDPREKVADWFEASCEGQGWKQAATMQTGDGLMLMYGSPDEKQSVTVMLATDEGKTTIAVTYGKK